MTDLEAELREARARIARLEAELARRSGGSGGSGALITVVLCLGVGVVLASGAAGVLLWMRRVPARPPVVSVSPPPTPASVALSYGMTWYPQSGIGPSFVDVDGDGTKEIVGLAWQSGNDASPLHVVALARSATYAPVWRSRAYPSQWQSELTHLAVAGDRIVVTDSRSDVHLIDARDGNELMQVHAPLPPRYVCASPDEPATGVLLADLSFNAKTVWLDATTGAFTPASKGSTCGLVEARDHRCRAGSTEACEEPSNKVIEAKSKTKGFWSTEVLREGDDRVSLGYAGEPSQAIAVGWDPKTRAIRWEAPLVAPGDKKHEGNAFGLAPLSVLSGGRLHFVYQSDAGVYRIVGRSAKTGEVLFVSDVPKSAEGSVLSSLTADGDEIFLLMNQTLHVFEAASGRVLASIGSF